MTVRLSEPDPEPGTSELPQIKSAIRQVTTAHFRLILTMQKLCLRAERREAGGTALDNAQISTARTLGGRGLKTLDLFLEDLIDALVTTIFHNAGGNSLGPLDALTRDTGSILGEHSAVTADIGGGSRLRGSDGSGG